jgi:hypothetical protein
MSRDLSGGHLRGSAVSLQNVGILSEEDRLFLMSIIEVYLPKDVMGISGEETMEALNEIELMWHEKIELESQKKILLRQLELKFGRLPAEFISQIESIKDPSILASLIDQILFAESLEEITISVKEIDES